MRRSALPATAVVLGLALTACGGNGSTEKASAGGDRTLTVWQMDGDLSPQAVAAINKRFEKATGAKVKVEIQEWNNINTKISTALAQDDAPDVVEIGNTDVPLFAATGALTDITGHRSDLAAGGTWLAGLTGPATVGGKLYAAPLFAGNRAVIYNKEIWRKAGVTEPPATYGQLTADLDKVRAANSSADFSAFYFPGKYWYGALQFVWDAGGKIAVKSGGRWRGTLSDAKAQAGIARWKHFQNTYSTPASRNVLTTSPDQSAVFAHGKASAVLDTTVNKILKDNPAMKGKLGTFPFPSATGSGNQPVFLGGSDLAIAARGRHQDLALAYLKTATDPSVQASVVVGMDHWTPISTQIIDSTQAKLPALSKAFTTAAKKSVATPASPGWATVESDQSINTLFADVATGRKTPAAAAKAFDTHLDQALNAAQ
ncbi:extracellular solute-binding protein [Streptomyces sp. NRRL F-5126]|uniref:extracellular solute-binding protein n=1 Tax=Streptomyces sp. NRRL F-5126 TaxID=1463857 RepID=UPI0004C9086C|nr:extracellular solute-binding protein [Streptomyces sp. NRRL F-5126]